jgi:TRAP-type uncharacterized transport system substrate-binding protein
MSRLLERRLLRWAAFLVFALSSAPHLPLPQAAAREPAKAASQAAASTVLRKSAGANPRVIEIVSETLDETEFRIAVELASAVASAQETGPNGEVALRVTPVVSRGGVQAVRDVLTLPNADFGIVASRVLDRVRETGELGEIKDRITYVAPLYDEEVHLLAGPDVRALTDLQGQVVSIGEDEGATQMIAREILSGAGVRVREERMDLRASIAALKAGGIAAAFLVSGKPVDGLLALSPGDGLRLVPITLPSLPLGFVPSTLTAEDYPELLASGERVDTLAVKNVLFAYNWPSKSSRARLGEFFLQSLFWRLATLQAPPRHPKWRQVNLAGTLPGWRRLASMEAWLRKTDARQQEFDRFLTQTRPETNPIDREALFREFLRWRDPSNTGSR